MNNKITKHQLCVRHCPRHLGEVKEEYVSEECCPPAAYTLTVGDNKQYTSLWNMKR